MKSKMFWDWEPFLRGDSCNIVFTASSFVEFFEQYCRSDGDKWEICKNLENYSIRAERSAFNAGSVVIKPSPPLTRFNLGDLPCELIIRVMEQLSPAYSSPRKLQSLSLTCKRIRLLTAPFLFSRLVLNNKRLRQYQYPAKNVAPKLKMFLKDPVPRCIFKYVSTISFNAQYLNIEPENFGREAFEALRDCVSLVAQERENHGSSLTKFFFKLPDIDEVFQLSDTVQPLTDFLQTLPRLRTLYLVGGSGFYRVAERFLNPVPAGVRILCLGFPNFIENSDHLTLPPLRYLSHYTLPLSNYSPLWSNSKLETLVLDNMKGFPRGKWGLEQLWDALSLCADTLKLLHIKGQEIGIKEWLSATHDTQGAIRPGRAPIPFRHLTILRLSRISKVQSEGERNLGRYLADFFSLAPIRLVYFVKNSDLLKTSEDAANTPGERSFWEGVLAHRVRGRSGWKVLEKILHGESLTFERHAQTGRRLEHDGIVLEWYTSWDYDPLSR